MKRLLALVALFFLIAFTFPIQQTCLSMYIHLRLFFMEISSMFKYFFFHASVFSLLLLVQKFILLWNICSCIWSDVNRFAKFGHLGKERNREKIQPQSSFLLKRNLVSCFKSSTTLFIVFFKIHFGGTRVSTDCKIHFFWCCQEILNFLT